MSKNDLFYTECKRLQHRSHRQHRQHGHVKNRNNIFEIAAIFEHARKFLQLTMNNKNFRHSRNFNAKRRADFRIERFYDTKLNRGGLNLVITNPAGNLLIKNSLTQNQGALSPSLSSFIVQNNTGRTVAYVKNQQY